MQKKTLHDVISFESKQFQIADFPSLIFHLNFFSTSLITFRLILIHKSAPDNLTPSNKFLSPPNPDRCTILQRFTLQKMHFRSDFSFSTMPLVAVLLCDMLFIQSGSNAIAIYCLLRLASRRWSLFYRRIMRHMETLLINFPEPPRRADIGE